MEELKYITRFKKRFMFIALLNSILYGLICAFGLTALITLVLFLFKVKSILISCICFVGLTILFSFLFYFSKFKLTNMEMAKKLDKLGLDERVVTMLEYQDNTGVLSKLQRNDTGDKLKLVNEKDIKILIGKKILFALCISVILFFSTLFLPNPQAIEDTPPDEIIEDIPSEEDLIIQEMLEAIRKIIDETEIDDDIKNRLYEVVNKLEEDLKGCETTSTKVTLIKEVMKKINEIIDYYLTERNLGQALQMYDPFTGEDFVTSALGNAIYDKNLQGVDSSLEDFKQQILASSNKRSNEFENLRNEYAKSLDEALKRASLEDNEALIEAITKFRDALAEATIENIAQIIDTAKEDIKKALLEDPTGNKEEQAAEDMKEEISDAFMDALEQLEKEEVEDEIETEGESEENQDETTLPTIPDNPLESEPIIDGETPYLQEYDKYVEIINNLLSSYETEEIPDSIRKIIEEYLKILK